MSGLRPRVIRRTGRLRTRIILHCVRKNCIQASMGAATGCASLSADAVGLHGHLNGHVHGHVRVYRATLMPPRVHMPILQVCRGLWAGFALPIGGTQ